MTNGKSRFWAILPLLLALLLTLAPPALATDPATCPHPAEKKDVQYDVYRYFPDSDDPTNCHKKTHFNTLTVCGECGTMLDPGDDVIEAPEQHAFTDGVCVCGYRCLHPEASKTTTGNYDVLTPTEGSEASTHTRVHINSLVQCGVCKVYIESDEANMGAEAHAFTNGVCGDCSYVCQHPEGLFRQEPVNEDAYIQNASDRANTHTHMRVNFKVYCGACGLLRSTDETVVDLAEAHTFTESVCVCGYTCPHPEGSRTVTGDYDVLLPTEGNEASTHTLVHISSMERCGICTAYIDSEETTMGTEAHTFTDGACACGYPCPHPEANRMTTIVPVFYSIAPPDSAKGHIKTTTDVISCGLCGEALSQTDGSSKTEAHTWSYLRQYGRLLSVRCEYCAYICQHESLSEGIANQSFQISTEGGSDHHIYSYDIIESCDICSTALSTETHTEEQAHSVNETTGKCRCGYSVISAVGKLETTGVNVAPAIGGLLLDGETVASATAVRVERTGGVPLQYDTYTVTGAQGANGIALLILSGGKSETPAHILVQSGYGKTAPICLTSVNPKTNQQEVLLVGDLSGDTAVYVGTSEGVSSDFEGFLNKQTSANGVLLSDGTTIHNDVATDHWSGGWQQVAKNLGLDADGSPGADATGATVYTQLKMIGGDEVDASQFDGSDVIGYLSYQSVPTQGAEGLNLSSLIQVLGADGTPVAYFYGVSLLEGFETIIGSMMLGNAAGALGVASAGTEQWAETYSADFMNGLTADRPDGMLLPSSELHLSFAGTELQQALTDAGVSTVKEYLAAGGKLPQGTTYIVSPPQKLLELLKKDDIMEDGMIDLLGIETIDAICPFE